MYKKLRPFVLIVFALFILGVGLAAQMPDRPHPIFEGLKVGERYAISWGDAERDRIGVGYCEITNNPGNNRVVKIGSDYIVFESGAHTLAVPITQIRFVRLRPSGRRL